MPNLYPLETRKFKNVTIGYFHWIVEDKVIPVVRICGELENGDVFDQLFKYEYEVGKMVNKLCNIKEAKSVANN